MNPIYKFFLSANGNTITARPVFPDSLAIDYTKEQGQQFFRGALSGKLTFEKTDYAFIVGQAFDERFDFAIEISYDGGQTWAAYWAGKFWKTDCEFNDDDQTVIVAPKVNDRYCDILAGMEKEYDLISLAPEIRQITFDKRPCLQMYIPNSNSVGMALFGTNVYWESECEAINNPWSKHFGAISDQYPIEVGFNNAQYPPTEGIVLISTNPVTQSSDINYGNYTLHTEIIPIPGQNPQWLVRLTRNSDGAQWQKQDEYQTFPVELYAVPGTGADYQYTYINTLGTVSVYGRIITDNQSESQFDIPSDDFVADNRNYRYCLPFQVPNNNLIVLSGNLTSTPTPYGIYQPGKYYDVPNSTGHFVPMARAGWGRYSIWLNLDEFVLLQSLGIQYSEEQTLRDCYPLSSVISVLLGQIAPGISHAATTDYSEFLYAASNPISAVAQTLFITPKSNIINAGYDQPAQKAPITLKIVLDMLRDCFRCYWFIDDDGRLRIEHISYFMNGGAYPGTPGFPVTGIDLTTETITRNGKPLAFALNKYQYEKPDMTERYQFGWMDDVTELFEGFPIDIVSGYVEPGKIENIDVRDFTSDVDYILLNPSEISQDGFVLLGAKLNAGQYELPYYNYVYNTIDHYLQNGWVSFAFLQQYYAYDMPAKKYRVNGLLMIAHGVKKLMTQAVKFPILQEPNFTQLIKTGLGNGTIEKLSVNLSSRNVTATLRYATE